MLKGSSLLSLKFALISPLEIEDGDQDVVESTWSDIIRVCNKTVESVWDKAENWQKEKSQRDPDMCPRLIPQVNEVYKKISRLGGVPKGTRAEPLWRCQLVK